jgi:hypothetical protein
MILLARGQEFDYYPQCSTKTPTLATGGRGKVMQAMGRRHARIYAGAFLTLLVGGLVAPATARATCGDHTSSRSQRDASRYDAGLLDVMHGALSSTDPMPSPPVRPCHGPLCSRKPSQSPIPTPMASPVSGERWCCTSAQTPTPDRGSALGSSDEIHVHSLRRSCPIDHPPRPSRSHSSI